MAKNTLFWSCSYEEPLLKQHLPKRCNLLEHFNFMKEKFSSKNYGRFLLTSSYTSLEKLEVKNSDLQLEISIHFKVGGIITDKANI